MQVQLTPRATEAAAGTRNAGTPRETLAAIAPPTPPPKGGDADRRRSRWSSRKDDRARRSCPRLRHPATTAASCRRGTPPPTPAPAGDLASFIAAQRRARGETASTPSTNYNRNLAANLPTAAHGRRRPNPKNGGGIFEIKRLAYDDAVFEFYGWNKDVGQRTPQSFEVRKGNNPDMRIAVVRRMIVIIREHENEDFVWESHRLGRNVTLSARAFRHGGTGKFHAERVQQLRAVMKTAPDGQPMPR